MYNLPYVLSLDGFSRDMLALNTLNMAILLRHFEFWPQLHLTDLEISSLDCLTSKTYGLTPRNPSCATQYQRYWIRKVDGGHLGKWRRVQNAHICDGVITQFLDPHTAMIDFRHADKCCYSAAGTLLFLGPLLLYYMHWNSRPESVRAATDLRSFKKNLKTYYLSSIELVFILFILLVTFVMPGWSGLLWTSVSKLMVHRHDDTPTYTARYKIPLNVT